MKKFTLMELLIVVAIIAILLSMLLPSLGKAREQGRKAVCMSNLKQVGIANMRYMKDHDQHFPPMITGKHKYGWLGSKGSDIYTQSPSKRRLNSYLYAGTITDNTIIKVAQCPSDTVIHQLTGASYAANTSSKKMGIPDTLFHNANGFKDSKTLWDIKSPHKFVIMAEHGAMKSAQGNSLGANWLFHDNDLRFMLLNLEGNVQYTMVASGRWVTDDYSFRTVK